ncbi:ARM repeat-containing protein [Patellaria atrata CBS 101060]|uniref:ARM repeat-containing protein n=1 Tax=Patellaria atrata CBS 101060 TaxID=1346257 RepID=A0A9P4S9J8_9PEZI|nr:ARM repeat-containing protein [Patellaria atrata CBS 101060]
MHSLDLTTQHLRIIGNCCADLGDNRTVSLYYLENIVECFQRPNLVDVTLSVLYNLCNDFEDGQTAAARMNLNRIICNLFTSGRLSPDTEAASRAIDLLSWSAERMTASILQEIVADDSGSSLAQILQLCLDTQDPEDYDNLLSVCVAYLRDKDLQQRVASQPALLTLLLNVYQDAVERLTDSQLASGNISKTLMNILARLSDVSALDAYSKSGLYSISSPFTQRLTKLLQSDSMYLRICGSILLGNLAVSDEACLALLQNNHVNVTLLDMLRTSTDLEVLHAAAGCLSHLARPQGTKAHLISDGILPATFRLFSFDHQTLRLDAAVIVRELTSHSYECTRHIIKDIVPADDVSEPETYHSSLLKMAQLGGPAALQIARAIIFMLRSIHSTDSESVTETDKSALLASFFHSSLVARPLLLLIKQEDPLLRSEAWFGLALMARHEAGATLIAKGLEDDNVFKRLEEVLTIPGRKRESSFGSMRDFEWEKEEESPVETRDKKESVAKTEDALMKAGEEGTEKGKMNKENALVMVLETSKNAVGDVWRISGFLLANELQNVDREMKSKLRELMEMNVVGNSL